MSKISRSCIKERTECKTLEVLYYDLFPETAIRERQFSDDSLGKEIKIKDFKHFCNFIFNEWFTFSGNLRV